MDKITELKAKAYDILAGIQHLQSELQKVNAEIAKLSQEQKEKIEVAL